MENKTREMIEKKLVQLDKEPITQVQLVKYAGASGDYNRIHIDEKFSETTPLKGVIAHGMLSMGFLGQFIDAIASTDFHVNYFKVRFREMVRPGEVISCIGTIKEESDSQYILDIKAENQDGKTVTLGEASLSFIGNKEEV